jgi:hypothetical protein
VVVRGHGIVWRALEDEELGGLPGDDRNGLHSRGARADDGDALAGEIDRLVRPSSGVIGLAAEASRALEIRRVRR